MHKREPRPRSTTVTRSQSLSKERKITEFTKPAARTRSPGPTKMGDQAEVTTCELKTLMQTLITDLKKDMNSNFSALSADVTKLTSRLEKNEEKIEKIESDITTLNFDMSSLNDAMKEIPTTDIAATLESFHERIRYLERAEMENAIHSRKYNLMFHGIAGNETDNISTEEKVRQLIAGELGHGEAFAKSVDIANCHRLPKPKHSTWGNKGDPDPVVVKFVRWSDRERVLRSTKNLAKDSKIRIRTHLPAPLAKARAKLSTAAYEQRKGGVHARVRERGASLVMDTREGPLTGWRTAETISLDQIIDFRIGGCKSLDLMSTSVKV